MAKFLWVITKVHLEDRDDGPTEVGKGNHDIERANELPYKFKLYDDDGELYYEGRCNDRDGEDAFTPLDWAMHYAGCTEIRYLQDSGKWEQL